MYIYIISYKLLLLIIIATIIMIMVINNNNCIMLQLLFYDHCFHHISFYFNIHNFIFHLISFISFICLHTHHGKFFYIYIY